MLSMCRAYVIAHTAAQDRTLRALADRVGFHEIGSALRNDPIGGDGSRRIAYFFIHYKLSDQAMQAVVASIRSSADPLFCYAPVILITEDLPFEMLFRFVAFGFDDIVALPDKRSELMSRLISQLNRDQVYIETDTYLGPDRRRFEAPEYIDSRRRADTPHERLTIRRNPATGIRVVRRELLGSQPPPPQIQRWAVGI